MGKLVTSKKKLNARQKQCLAWSSDSNLWGNQLLPRKIQVLDRTKVLHDPRTQTYGKTSYFQEKSKYQTEPRSYMVLELKPMGKLVTSKKNPSTRMNQGLAWSSDSNLWGNQLLPGKTQVLDKTKVLYGPRTQTYGETSYSQETSKYQTELRSCMVLGLKPTGKLVTSKKNPSTRQNQGLAWSSDSNLWGNQLLPKNI